MGTALLLPVVLAAPSTAWAAASRIAALQYLSSVAKAAGLSTPAIHALSSKVAQSVAPATMDAIAVESFQRMREAIGTVLESASATLPALVDDDYSTGRTVVLHGVSFAHTELALFFSLGSQART